MNNVNIVVLGQFNADIIVKPVDRFPRLGTLDKVDLIDLQCGGCGLNTAIGLSKLGLNVGVAGKVGKDAFGDFVLKQLKGRCVNIQAMKTSSNISTSSIIVLIAQTGERTFLYRPGANEETCFSDIDLDLFVNARILHIGGIMKMYKLDPACVLNQAQKKGMLTSVDTDWDDSKGWLDWIKPSLPYIDIFMPSIEEARMISQKESPQEIAEFFLPFGLKVFVLKMGKDGCYVRTSNTELSIPSYKNIVAVDTTGAGDAFAAGFLTGYFKGWTLEKSAKLANACGAMCVTALGAINGIKNLEETMAFIESNRSRVF